MIIKPYNQVLESEKEKIISLYYDGLSFKLISESLLVSQRAVPRILQESGINTRLKNRYTLNQDYFSSIDASEKAYWLGFIYADGYVGNSDFNNIVISLKESDIGHLEKFKEVIEYTGTIRDAGKGGYEGSTNRHCINFSNEKMANDLRNLGLYPGKSMTMSSFPSINKKFLPDFIRGYFDGDGSVYQSRNTSYHKEKLYEYQKINISIIGTQKFLEEMKIHMPYASRFRNSKTEEMKYLEFYGTKDMRLIYNFFYKDATVFLDRKFSKFTQLVGPLVS